MNLVQVWNKVLRKVRKKVCQARCHETWMRWNSFKETRRLHPTGTSNILSHVHTRKMCVCHVIKCARCGVLFFFMMASGVDWSGGSTRFARF